MRKLSLFILALFMVSVLAACGHVETATELDLPGADGQMHSSVTSSTGESTEVTNPSYSESFDLNSIPVFSNSPFVILNNNVPTFTADEISTESYEYYSELDSLGRCGVCIASIGPDIMPTEERGEIGQVKPTGWHTVKYDIVDGKYLYNRCHLIGYQLTGENANRCNLITGTRYLNVTGMLPFENEVANYVKSSGNHVMYRVIPVYEGNNLVASGLTMEAYSVEDNGEGVQFYVYCYNEQPGVWIDHATGDSQLISEGSSTTSTGTETVTATSTNGEIQTYVLNTSSHKFHLPSCESAKSMSKKNRQEYTGIREDVISMGYEACGACKP